MKCTLAKGIDTISGKIGGVLYKTYKRRDGKMETRAYLLPKRKDGSYGYERKTPLSENEIAARSKFAAVRLRVANLTEKERHEYALQMHRDKNKFNGKLYATLNGYIMARFFAELKDGVNVE